MQKQQQQFRKVKSSDNLASNGQLCEFKSDRLLTANFNGQLAITFVVSQLFARNAPLSLAIILFSMANSCMSSNNIAACSLNGRKICHVSLLFPFWPFCEKSRASLNDDFTTMKVASLETPTAIV